MKHKFRLINNIFLILLFLFYIYSNVGIDIFMQFGIVLIGVVTLFTFIIYMENRAYEKRKGMNTNDLLVE